MNIFNQIITYIRNPTQRKKLLLISSGSFIAAGWALNWIWNLTTPFNILMIAATLFAGYDIVLKAWHGLKSKHTNIELLVSIAATGGLLIGVYWESAAVTFLFLFGGWLEMRTLNKTRNTLSELIDLAPSTAILLEDDKQIEIPAHEVKSGQLVLIKPGSRIPIDGIVENGQTLVNESAVTGEPLPVEKTARAEVYAGTLNQNGVIKVRVTQAGADTTLAKIIRRVEEAQEDKAPTQRFIERFAKLYTPAIVLLSAGTFAFTQNIELALTLLVIGCPGALVISTPVSVITGIGRAAKDGILIKGGEYLENAGKVTAIAFDKTGTLTEGKPTLTDILIFKPQLEPVIAGAEQSHVASEHFSLHENEEVSEEIKELLYWAGIAEKHSEHPLAKPILHKAAKFHELPDPDKFESMTGLGARVKYKSDKILIGNQALMDESNVSVKPEQHHKIKELTETGRSVVLVAVNKNLLGALFISDPIRPESKQMISTLRKNGIKKILMLSGDNQITANAVAKEVGLHSDEVFGGLLPDDKLQKIQQLKKDGHIVAMVGDGINDAPALAASDIGIAMGAAGSDTALETAHIALMNDDLLKIPRSLGISRATIRNINQNIVVALVTVLMLLIGVFAGSVHMAGGMLVHELSVFLVILNGLRLKWT